MEDTLLQSSNGLASLFPLYDQILSSRAAWRPDAPNVDVLTQRKKLDLRESATLLWLQNMLGLYANISSFFIWK